MTQPSLARSLPAALALPRAAVRDGALAFVTPGGLRTALRAGCFALELPAALDVEPGRVLSRQFYRSQNDGDSSTESYRGFRDRPGIYFDREHFQTEHVLLDRPARAQWFPPALVALCEQMNDLALLVLRSVLAEVGVARADWSRATGGAVDNGGTHWFASSHYRPERAQLGCAPHQDTGFVTVLYLEQPGLEARVDGAWLAIDPVPGCFIVNFGGALEILTRHARVPVHAILHRVQRTHRVPGIADRFSFAAFVNPPATGMLYQCDADGAAHPHQRVEDFLAEFNKATWNDRHDEFGIR